nr:hypothetical protein [Streptomyces spongiae]
MQIWRSVQLLRTVQQTVHDLSATLPGRAAAIAESGALLVAHLMFQRADTEAIDDLDTDWQPTLNAAPELTAQTLAHLISEVDRQYGSHSFVSRTFTQAAASRELAAAVLASFDSQGHHPELASYQRPPEPRRGRRPNPMRLLVDQHRLQDGDFLLGPAGVSLPGNVVTGALVTTHTDERDPVEGRVGGTVTAAGEPVPVGLPLEAGTGATPHKAAKDASLRRRAVLSPAVIKSCVAVSGPTP